MARADSPERVAGWAGDRAIDLWVLFGDGFALAAAVEDGAIVRSSSGTTPSSNLVFDAMRVTGVDDVRRVGVASSLPAGLVAARQSGAGAVVAVDTGAGPSKLLAAEPDAICSEAGFADLYARRYGSERPFRPQVLLNPGPALTTEAVKRAAAGVDLCHREPEFGILEAGIRRKLRQVAEIGPDWDVALISGSGTAAAELSIRAARRPGRRMLVVVNGVYGERLATIAERAGAAVVRAEFGWTEPADVRIVAQLIGRTDKLDTVAVVHHETTTGLLNPVAEIAAAAAAADVRVVLDGVSSFGVEELTLEGSGIDFLACSSNKCLQGLPGAAFVLVSPAGRQRLEEVPPTSVYLDLAGYLRGVEIGSVPFTPAIPALAAFDAALDEVLALGPAEHRRRYAERAATLDEVLGGLGLEPIVSAGHRSRTVRSVRLPDGVEFERLHDELKQQGYVIYAGQGPLAKEIFRVCCMGALEPDVLRDFGARLESVLDREAVEA